jgi:acetyl esterase/lipase
MVEEIVGVSYDPSAPDCPKRQLDIYKPVASSSPERCQTCIFLHGGGWKRFDRRTIVGVHQNVGKALAARGILTVIPSYRLSGDSFVVQTLPLAIMLSSAFWYFAEESLDSWQKILLSCIICAGVVIRSYCRPTVLWPTHIRDCAAAVKWAVMNAEAHGGRPEIVIIGHSAGAHIAAMLCICPEFLEAVQLSPKNVAGLVTMSGVYSATRFAAHPIFRFQFMHPVFGSDPSKWNDCFPLEAGQARTKDGQSISLPPTLVTTSQYEFSLQSHANDWVEFLAEHSAQDVQNMRVPGSLFSSNHFSIIFSFNCPGYPAQELILPAIVKFCRQVSTAKGVQPGS